MTVTSFSNNRYRRWLAGPAMALIVLIAVFFAADVVLLAVAPLPNPITRLEAGYPFVNQYVRIEYPREFVVESKVEPGLPGMSGTHIYTTNNVGFRGDQLIMPKPEEEYRIVVVGGSTTECFYLDDRECLTAVLQAHLAEQGSPERVFRVYGAGFSGAASDDHVALVGQRIVHLQPDLIVLFCGINDLTRSIFDFDYLHFVDRTPPLEIPRIKRLLLNTQIFRRIYYLRRHVSPAERQIQEEFSQTSDYARKVELRRSVAESPGAVPRTDTLSFANNLRTIIGSARANGARVALITQPSSWNSTVDSKAVDWHWMTLRRGVTYPEAALDAALEQFNDATRDVASALDVPLYDLSLEIPKSLQYFYDDCHFNVEGARFAGSRFATFLVKEAVVPTR